MNCEHEPDMATLHVNSDGGAIYLDVSCAKCGVSGCVGELRYDSMDGILAIVTNDGMLHQIAAPDLFDAPDERCETCGKRYEKQDIDGGRCTGCGTMICSVETKP